jgi:asparagine synthase (glutamine-hydrolysing)
MCGITGMIVSQSHEGSSIVLRNMTAKIKHRGPDDEGYFETFTKGNRFYVGLGHCRLSIIDLSTGHQPLSNEDGRLQIVFNGEIYNFQELRDELISLGHRFATASDTETIVHAYEEYGEKCVERFRGMFAFAIWDANRDLLFLARDRYGKKPLFVWKQNEDLWFASEIKALLATERIDIKVDSDAVYDYLSYRYVPSPTVLFHGIKKLPPASYAIWEKGHFNITRYYTLPDQQPYKKTSLPKDPVDEFLIQLDEAVACRMVSDVPFGAFLSGGIDSSAIVALMARHSDLPVKTFSVGFSETQYSELRYARTIAKQFKTEHQELVVSQDDLMDKLPLLVQFRDAPVTEPSDIPIYLLSKEARKSIKMVLTGEGSDEILGGYPKHTFETYVRFYQLVPNVLRARLIEPLIKRLPYSFRRAKTAISTMGLEDYEERMVRWFGALSTQELERLTSIRPSAERSIPDWKKYPLMSRSSLRSILSFDQTSWLPDNLLERGDRMTMAASLEARMPFMDHNLAEYVSSLPDNYRIRGKTTKWLLRVAMERLLPKAILERPKVGFRVPVNEWFRGPMKDYLYEHLTSSNSMTRDYYKPAELHRILKEHVSGNQNHEKLLWCLLNLEIWHREYVKAS